MQFSSELVFSLSENPAYPLNAIWDVLDFTFDSQLLLGLQKVIPNISARANVRNSIPVISV